jgi:phosphopantothenoylcysteine decarboxylase/phosphopantothenate--cysteine ligase
MNCVVTAGPTYESLDDVRRLTNFSTGRLGTELAGFLLDRGHHVTLLIGEQATFRGEPRAQTLQAFTTTADLLERLKTLSRQTVDAVFHAAAVSDYTFGRIWVRSASGEMVEVRSGKISTRDGPLLAELIPTPKIIAQLRDWYPDARLVGWKFEVEGNRDDVIRLAERQMMECHLNATVANGRAYGPGFGLVTGAGSCGHFADRPELFTALEKLAG